MWECKKCRESVEDTFDVCWKCGTSMDGVEDLSFRPEPDWAGDGVGAALGVALGAAVDHLALGLAFGACVWGGSGCGVACAADEHQDAVLTSFCP